MNRKEQEVLMSLYSSKTETLQYIKLSFYIDKCEVYTIFKIASLVFIAGGVW